MGSRDGSLCARPGFELVHGFLEAAMQIDNKLPEIQRDFLPSYNFTGNVLLPYNPLLLLSAFPDSIIFAMLSFTLPVGAALLGFTQLAASASIPSFGFELAKSIPDNGNINHPILEPVFHHITNRHHHMHIRAAEGHGLRYHQKRDNSFGMLRPSNALPGFC